MSRGRSIGDTSRDAYRHWVSIELRYGDTDRQGHINNAVFCTLLESGRVAFLFDGEQAICGPGQGFVIARLALDFLSEMKFPGTAEIGSRVLSIGSSSFTIGQAIFKDGACCSTAESVLVLIDESTGKSASLSEVVLERLRALS